MQARDENRLKQELRQLRRLEERNIISILSYDSASLNEYDIHLAVKGPHFPGTWADDRSVRLCDAFHLRITLPQDYPVEPARVVIPAGSPVPFTPHFTPEDGEGRSEWRDPVQHDRNEMLDGLIERIGRTIALEESHIYSDKIVNSRASNWLKGTEGQKTRKYFRFPGDGTALAKTVRSAHIVNDRGTLVVPDGDPTLIAAESHVPALRHRKTFAIIDETPKVEFPTMPPPTGTVVMRSTGVLRDAPRLFIRAAAMRRILGHIAWERRTRANLVEQGGLLLGRVYRHPDTGVPYAEVLSTVEAQASRASSAYLEMDHATWKGMLDRIDRSVADGRIPNGLLVVGWYHTHPNGLGVFMSGTDQATQRSLFHEAWQFAIVLNPHRQLWEAFAGAECRDCVAVVLVF